MVIEYKGTCTIEVKKDRTTLILSCSTKDIGAQRRLNTEHCGLVDITVKDFLLNYFQRMFFIDLDKRNLR